MAAVPSEALADRIAGAPISWGVCEVPGWGHQLSPEVVLAQIRSIVVDLLQITGLGVLEATDALPPMR